MLRFAWVGGATPKEFITRLNMAIGEGWEVFHMHHHPPFLGCVLSREREQEIEPDKPEFKVLTFPKED